MASELGQEIIRFFGNAVASNEELMSECISVCQNYNLNPESLLWKWEALNFKSSSTRSEISPFTMESIGALKVKIQKELAKENSKKLQQRPTKAGNVAVINRSRLPANMARAANAGIKAGVHVKAEQSGGVDVAGLSVVDPSVAGPGMVVIKGPKMDVLSKKNRAYRYMYEKISERSEALDDRIDEFGELVREYYNISELADPSSSTDEETTVVGRITHDTETTSVSKLSEASLTLESSRMLASGARVPLRFDPSLKIRRGPQGSGTIGLFPGAIVALKGKNGGGGWFLVTEILALPPLRPSPISLGIENPKPDLVLGHTPFSMCIVSGPYTSDADLSYKPWRTLLTTIKSSKPTVILLIGPFIDATHPKIKAGDIDSTPAALFRARFTDPLRAFLDSSPGSIVLIVPNVRDLISQHAVFPQCELGGELSGGDHRIHMLPNPARFAINGVRFAVSSVDVLFHLRKEEFLKRGQEVDSIPSGSADDVGTDSMANICRHILQQRSFYPIFPVPLELSHEVNLDVTHSQGLRLTEEGDNNYAPDVLVLPSRLKHFTKAVQTTTVVNPAFLTKGTYSLLNAAAWGAPGERTRAEVVKLEE